VLLDALEGHPHLDLVLKAQKYGEDVGFDSEGAKYEIQEALAKLELKRRKKGLDELRGRGLNSRDELIAFNEKNLAYKRLQGALPTP